ncbi:PTS system cellobiose-specific IIB component [Breznakia blatticola]|uniref:PTS system cellobiose-specific IIB component n=1 Tax=Breznakia blatticola TaxID=1754012 RepID=A0A4R7ZS07_9FIRM|nr:PTS sugar transporter subunit IIB [Breznakia blatticola]TDW20542.1 PTS system cellobiose-specific IIB component [Breznakia blatticola]
MDNQKEYTILLICSAGVSTGIIVKQMQHIADQRGLHAHIYSAPALLAEQIIQTQKLDALLIGPQSEYEINRLKDYLQVKAIPYTLIKKEDYETINGNAILDEAIELISNSN